MLRFAKKITVFALLILMMSPVTLAQDPPSSTGDAAGDTVDPGLVASSPNDCHTREHNEVFTEPVNCIFLLEPIGGDPGYDLYIIETKTKDGDDYDSYKLWNGGSIPQTAHGPVQALLSFEKDKPYQGPFGLLYGYLGLVYGYMSGLIVGIAVLFVVIGGVQMTTSGGDTEKFGAGKARIVKAIVGMILWFTASLILYTINPTFFAF